MATRFWLVPMMLVLLVPASCVTPGATSLGEGDNRWSIRCEVSATIKDFAFFAYPVGCEIENLADDAMLQLRMGEAPAPEGFTVLGQDRLDELLRTRSSVAKSVFHFGATPIISGTSGGDGRGALIWLGASILMRVLNPSEKDLKAEKKEYIEIAPGQRQTLQLILESKDRSNLAVQPPQAIRVF